MGEEDASAGGDPQRLKRIAAAAYDYENDARWAGYWSNVLVPPHLASRPDVVDHFKRKFYQRYIVSFPHPYLPKPPRTVAARLDASLGSIGLDAPHAALSSIRLTLFSALVPGRMICSMKEPDPGLVVEPMSSMTSTQSSRPAAKSSATPSSENVRARDSGSSTRSTGTSQHPPAERTANSLQLDGRTINFSINAWVLVVASLGILPVLPNHISSKAYRLSLLGTICSSAYSLYGTYGKPRAWNMPAIQSWLQSIIVAKDFVHLMFSLMMFTSNVHFKIALLPVLCWALDHVARFLRRNFTHSSLYRSRRNIIQTFMYFHVSYTALKSGFPFLISSPHGHTCLKMQHYFCT
ncbi:hypothetical protein Zm00014a_038003 [Zea mays]|uniref:Uncharacterized protein n=1 Tax=Zea mays TaxID=4577 RepID=A0A3L6FGA6_MAIZE|nr:hypothetical protein Zm00014a_038003 [Zea mays]